ncbi:MAG TPA: hypothetical protein VN026_02505 [Bacteroidia bacterium]|nr:hypothetical protein [Bacteroidia bacterium]
MFLIFAIVIYLDSLDGKIKIALQAVYIAGIISYSIVTFQNQLIYYKNDARNFSLKRISLFKPLANSGVIGNYWYSYILGINSDMNIKTTSHEHDYVRCPRMVDSVLSKKNIFIIGTEWLNNFPDTVKQYGLSLIKTGLPQKISNVTFCRYQLADLHTVYYPKAPDQYKGTLALSEAERLRTPFITDSTKYYPVEFFVYGPFCKLPPGKHKVTFELLFSPTFKQNGGIIFDVAENWGGIILATKTINFTQIQSREPYTISLTVDTKTFRSLIECRMKLSGSFNFQFNKVSIDRMPD